MTYAFLHVFLPIFSWLYVWLVFFKLLSSALYFPFNRTPSVMGKNSIINVPRIFLYLLWIFGNWWKKNRIGWHSHRHRCGVHVFHNRILNSPMYFNYIFHWNPFFTIRFVFFILSPCSYSIEILNPNHLYIRFELFRARDTEHFK